jgi:hypothetical protein
MFRIRNECSGSHSLIVIIIILIVWALHVTTYEQMLPVATSNAIVSHGVKVS